MVFIPKIKRANFTSQSALDQSANVVPVIDDEKLVDAYIRDKVLMRNSTHCISDWLFRRNDLIFDRQLLKKDNKETSWWRLLKYRRDV